MLLIIFLFPLNCFAAEGNLSIFAITISDWRMKIQIYMKISFFKGCSQCRKLFKLDNESPLCSPTAEIRLNAKTKSQCISKCLDLGESCMKLTAKEYDCFISSKVTTEPCNTTEVKTFIVTQSTCTQPDTVTITAGVGVNIAAGEIIIIKVLKAKQISELFGYI